MYTHLYVQISSGGQFLDESNDARTGSSNIFRSAVFLLNPFHTNNLTIAVLSIPPGNIAQSVQVQPIFTLPPEFRDVVS